MTTTAEVRAALIDVVEDHYYSGASAGQMWLHDLSACLRGLPDGDAVLQRLAATPRFRPLGRYLYGERGREAARFDPRSFLERYAAWATEATNPQGTEPHPHRN